MTYVDPAYSAYRRQLQPQQQASQYQTTRFSQQPAPRVQPPAPMPMRNTQPMEQPPAVSSVRLPHPESVDAIRPKMRVRLPPGQDANLYSLLYAIEVLEDEWCNGFVSNEDHQKLFPKLKEQFMIICNALNLRRADVTQFCEDVQLHCGYAMNVLYDDVSVEPTAENDTAAADGVNLGTAFATLSDRCAMESGTVAEFLELVQEIYRILNRYGVLHRNDEVRTITQRWMTALGSLTPTDRLSQDYIERLKNDLPIWRVSACDSLG